MKIISLDSRVLEEEKKLRVKDIKEFSIEPKKEPEKPDADYKTNLLLTAMQYMPDRNYSKRIRKAKRDFTMLVPNKRLQRMKMPAGLYGFTYLGHDFMAINDSLLPAKNYETQVHEAIHTPDEYETRLLTWWMMSEKDDDPYLLDQEYSKAA